MTEDDEIDDVETSMLPLILIVGPAVLSDVCVGPEEIVGDVWAATEVVPRALDAVVIPVALDDERILLELGAEELSDGELALTETLREIEALEAATELEPKLDALLPPELIRLDGPDED